MAMESHRVHHPQSAATSRHRLHVEGFCSESNPPVHIVSSFWRGTRRYGRGITFRVRNHGVARMAAYFTFLRVYCSNWYFLRNADRSSIFLSSTRAITGELGLSAD